MKKTLQISTLVVHLLVMSYPLGLGAMEQISLYIPMLSEILSDNVLDEFQKIEKLKTELKNIDKEREILNLSDGHYNKKLGKRVGWERSYEKLSVVDDQVTSQDIDSLSSQELCWIICADGDSEQTIIENLKQALKTVVNAENNLFDALTDAANRGYLSVVKFLVDQGANINSKENGFCFPLEIAVISGHMDIVKFLIAHGANINITRDAPFTILHSCLLNQNLSRDKALEIAKYLVDHGANINGKTDPFFNSNTILQQFCVWDNIKLVKFLVENGADIHIQNDQNETALQIAMNKGNQVIIDYLILTKDFEKVCNKTMTLEAFANKHFGLMNQNQVHTNFINTCRLILARGTYELFKKLFKHTIGKAEFNNFVISTTKSSVTQVEPGSDRWYLQVLSLALYYSNMQLCQAIIAQKPMLWNVIKNVVLDTKNTIDQSLVQDAQYFKNIWDKNTNDLFKKNLETFLQTQVALDGTVWLKGKGFAQNKQSNYDYKKDFTKDKKEIKGIVKIPQEITAKVLTFFNNK